MKIVLAVHHFPPAYRAGAELRAYRTSRALQMLGHEVHVVCIEPVSAQQVEQPWEDARYESLPVRRVFMDLGQVGIPLGMMYKNPQVRDAITDLVEHDRPDILHVIGGYLLSGSVFEVAQEHEIPLVLSLTDFWFFCPRINLVRSDGQLCPGNAGPEECAYCLQAEKRRYQWLNRLSFGTLETLYTKLSGIIRPPLLTDLMKREEVLKTILRDIQAIVAPSQFLATWFSDRGVHSDRIRFMRQGLDIADLPDPEDLETSPELCFGYVGQIADHKGVAVLIDAFQHLDTSRRQAKLVLYGNQDQFKSYTEGLKKITMDNDLVQWAGEYKYHDLSKVFHGLDVLIVPSLWYENSPNVILEAHAHQRAVLASNLGGMAELVRSEVDGLLFDVGDAQSLATQMQRFLDQPDLASSMGRNAPSVKTMKEEVQELDTLYQQLIHQHKNEVQYDN